MAQIINTGNTQAVVVSSGDATPIIASSNNINREWLRSTTESAKIVPTGKKWTVISATTFKDLSSESIVVVGSWSGYAHDIMLSCSKIADSFHSWTGAVVLTAGERITLKGTAGFIYYEEDS